LPKLEPAKEGPQDINELL